MIVDLTQSSTVNKIEAAYNAAPEKVYRPIVEFLHLWVLAEAMKSIKRPVRKKMRRLKVQRFLDANNMQIANPDQTVVFWQDGEIQSVYAL